MYANHLEQCLAHSRPFKNNVLLNAVETWIPPFLLPPYHLPTDLDGRYTNLTIPRVSILGEQTVYS